MVLPQLGQVGILRNRPDPARVVRSHYMLFVTVVGLHSVTYVSLWITLWENEEPTPTGALILNPCVAAPPG